MTDLYQLEKRHSVFRAREFAVADSLAYFDHASDSPLPARSARVIAERTRLLQYPSAEVRPREDYLACARARLSHLLNADANQFAFLTNIADATATVANGLDWRPGDEIVILRGEFASFVYPWQNLLARQVRVGFVDRGSRLAVDLNEIEAAIGPSTRVVAISHVEFESGLRHDLAAISAIAHAHDALLVVDASQSLGVLPIDIAADGVDVLVSVGYKWLMSPHGISILYVGRQVMDRIAPSVPGRYSVNAGWQTSEYSLDWLPNAERYQGGALNWIGLCALAESLGLPTEVGIGDIHASSMMTSGRILAELDDLGVEITSNRDPDRRSAILSFTLGSPERDAACVETGRERGIYFGHRGHGIRVGAHFWNNSNDVDRLIEHIRDRR